MQTEKKTFAFQLADKQRQAAPAKGVKWRAREGVALAGCTDPTGDGDYRYWFNYDGIGHDAGDWC